MREDVRLMVYRVIILTVRLRLTNAFILSTLYINIIKVGFFFAIMKAIIFDIDGVLLDSFEANLLFFQELMTKAGYPPPTRAQFSELFPLSMTAILRKLLPSEEEVVRVFALGESQDVAYHLELLHLPYRAKEVLLELKNKCVLGIVSSRQCNSLFEAPVLLALKEYFSVAIGYEHTERHKPHPEPLLVAAKKLGIDPKDAVYVGDVETDMLAANAAGMQFIYYSDKTLPGVKLQASSFDELLSIISSL